MQLTTTDTSLETITKALMLYIQWMDGLSQVNASSGDHEYASKCAVEAQKASDLLEQIKKENK
jgi:hypothetical protein